MTSLPMLPTNSRKSPSGHCSSVSSRHVLPAAWRIAIFDAGARARPDDCATAVFILCWLNS